MRNGSPLRREGPASMLAGRRDPVGHGPTQMARGRRITNGRNAATWHRSVVAQPRSAFPGGGRALGSMCSNSHASTPSKPSRHSSGLWIVRGIVSPRLRCCSNAAGASHRWWSRAARIGRCRSNSNGQNADQRPQSGWLFPLRRLLAAYAGIGLRLRLCSLMGPARIAFPRAPVTRTAAALCSAPATSAIAAARTSSAHPP
jgi:hypothetical protein